MQSSPNPKKANQKNNESQKQHPAPNKIDEIAGNEFCAVSCGESENKKKAELRFEMIFMFSLYSLIV
jgi:hypothetical protein